jgi:hypothetical protein
VETGRANGRPSENTWQTTIKSAKPSWYSPENLSMGFERSLSYSGFCRLPSSVPLWKPNKCKQLHEFAG